MVDIRFSSVKPNITIYNIEDLMEFKTEEKIKSAGKLRQEGKEYIVNDGDVIFFKFNV